MAPLQHMESLEEWSSAESMAHLNNSLDCTYSPLSTSRKIHFSIGARETNYDEIPESNLEYQDSSLKRSKSMIKESSVPNFAALDNSAVLNSRPASIVIEMDPNMAPDSQTSKV